MRAARRGRPARGRAIGAPLRLAPPLLAAMLLAALVQLAPWGAPWGAGVPAALAQDTIAAQTTVRSDEPREVRFTARVEVPGGVESARLVYRVLNPGGDVGGSGVAQVGAGSNPDLTFTLETINAQRYIPVGSEFAFHWDIVAADGTRTQTEEERYVFLDGRYQWTSHTEDGVTVYWYGNNQETAMRALQATRASLNETGALLQTDVPYVVKVMVWRNEPDGRAAMRPRGETFDSQVLTGGQRVAPDLLFVFEPTIDVIRHEAAHIVTHVAGDGAFSRIPSWLDEGVAVYMQTQPGFGYESAVTQAIRSDTTFRLRAMQSPANVAGQVNQFYGQSWSVVQFMIEELGEDRFADLFREVHQGAAIDAALRTVYGVDQDGLYNMWREHHGLEPREFAAIGQGTPVAPSGATVTPLTIPSGSGGSGAANRPPLSEATPAPAPGGESDGATAQTNGGASNATVALAVLGGSLLVAALFGGGGWMLMRRR